MKRLFKKIFPFLLLAASIMTIYFNDNRTRESANHIPAPLAFDNASTSLDLQANDVVVLLHIPGTGMTSLSQHLVTDLVTQSPCVCQKTKTRCSCTNLNKNHWLFQSYNATGFVCGEHADWTKLTQCDIDSWMENVAHDNRMLRRYWMITLLREPAVRFLQEWHQFVTRDAYFRNEPRLFRKESPELQKKGLPCLVGKKISTLSIRDFLDCKENPAINRMTFMLANKTEVESSGYHGDKYDEALLNSAIENLEQLPFFGISERMKDVQLLFEASLGLKFKRPLELLPGPVYKSVNEFDVSGSLLRSIRLANHLDVRLFEKALNIFDKQMNDIANIKPLSGPKLKRDVYESYDDNVDDYVNNRERLGIDNNHARKRGGDNYDDGEDDDESEDDVDYNNDEMHRKKLNVDESDLDPVALKDFMNKESHGYLNGKEKNQDGGVNSKEANDYYDEVKLKQDVDENSLTFKRKVENWNSGVDNAGDTVMHTTTEAMPLNSKDGFDKEEDDDDDDDDDNDEDKITFVKMRLGLFDENDNENEKVPSTKEDNERNNDITTPSSINQNSFDERVKLESSTQSYSGIKDISPNVNGLNFNGLEKPPKTDNRITVFKYNGVTKTQAYPDVDTNKKPQLDTEDVNIFFSLLQQSKQKQKQ